MKTIITLFIGFLLTMPLSAQVRPIQKSRVPVQKAMVQNRMAGSEKQVLKLADRPPSSVPENFVIRSVEQLKVQVPRDKIMTLSNYNNDNLNTNVGNQAYKNGDGVVLDALNPRDNETGSVVCLWHVTYSPVISDPLKNQTPFALRQLFFSDPNSAEENVLSIAAYFQDLATTPHLYLLTLGTSISIQYISISIILGHDNLGRPISYDVPADRLVASPGSSEIQVLFSSSALYDPQLSHAIPEFGDNFSSKFSFLILISYKSVGGGFDEFFYHLQLAQVD